MAKGPVITENIRQKIAVIYVDHPEWRAKEVEAELREELKDKAPGLSSVQKELGRIRTREAERSPEEEKLNRIWTIGDLALHEITPEAVRLLLLIQNQRGKELRAQLKVREALWVARLYAVRESGPIKQIRPLDLLASWGEAYALREKVCMISNTACDTSDLDEGLLKNIRRVNEKQADKAAKELIEEFLESEGREDHEEYYNDAIALEEVMAMESEYFAYALGDPTSETGNLGLYRVILKALSEDTKERLFGLTTEQQKLFFMSLKKWIKDNVTSLQQPGGKIPRGDPQWDKLFESIRAATAGIVAEINAKTPNPEIPVKAQRYFENAWKGNPKTSRKES